MFNVNNGNARTRCKICSKLTVRTPERQPIVELKKVDCDKRALTFFQLFSMT